VSKSITIFTETYPYGKGEMFLKGELEVLESHFDQIILFPLGDENLKPVWHKGNKGKPAANVIRLRTLFIKHWKDVLKIWRYERKATNNNSYLRKPFYFLKMAFYAIKKASELNQYLPKGTILYSYWYANWTLNISVLKSLYRSKAKWVTRMHGFDVDLQQVEGNYYPFRKWNNSLLNKGICVSDYGKQLFLTDNSEYEGKVVVNHLGIDEKEFAPIPKGKAYTIVSCSSVIPLKRLDKIASILSYLNRRVLWIHFGDGNDMKRIQSYLKGLPDNIGYEFKGHTANDDILKYYKENEIDLFINSSKLEGIPFSMMEAAAFGIPIAGFNVCGIPEIVSKKMGVLLDENISNEENAEKIKSFLLSSLGRDPNYRKNVQSELMHKFNAKNNYQMLVQLLLGK